MNDEPTGTYECPVCGLDSPHHHDDPDRDARVAVLAHVICGTYRGYHGGDKAGCKRAFQAMDRGVRREMWAVADRTLSELEATGAERDQRDALLRAALHAKTAEIATLRTRLAAAEAERDRYRSALRDVAREWPYLDLIDPQTAQECDLRGLVEYLLSAVRSEQRVAREALEGPSDA